MAYVFYDKELTCLYLSSMIFYISTNKGPEKVITDISYDNSKILSVVPAIVTVEESIRIGNHLSSS